MTKELIKIRKHFKESNILFQSDKAEAIDAAIEAVEYHRIELETYVRLRPHFAKTLQPITVDINAPLIIQKMANAAIKADVGPMAAVAGALADLAVEAMVRSGSRVSIVEDGGEVSAISDESFTVGLYAGQNALGHGLGFMIKPFDCPIGIATSSSTVSHAMSFGEADAAVIFAENATIADAAATAVCNSVVGDDVANSIKLGLEVGKKMSLVRGTLVVRGDYVGSAGWVPSLVQIEP
ncbi:UPF0280 family protein [Candidatus Bathyarchaeota archaeon]|nr:UPF0280 family protein [Candidatus Bathyarchaeota archaeon]